jgi:hypothetical protein
VTTSGRVLGFVVAVAVARPVMAATPVVDETAEMEVAGDGDGDGELSSEAEAVSEVPGAAAGDGEVRLEADVGPIAGRETETEVEVEVVTGVPRVHLEVRGRADVRLYEVLEAPMPAGRKARRRAPTYREVCAAPCDAVVDGRQGQQFVVGGPRLTRSVALSLAEAPARATLEVRPGPRALWVTGWIAAALGGTAVLGGATTLTLADDDRTLRRAGGFTFLAGLPLLAAATLMLAFGRTRTRYAASRR